MFDKKMLNQMVDDILSGCVVPEESPSISPLLPAPPISSSEQKEGGSDEEFVDQLNTDLDNSMFKGNNRIESEGGQKEEEKSEDEIDPSLVDKLHQILEDDGQEEDPVDFKQLINGLKKGKGRANTTASKGDRSDSTK